MLGEGKGGGSIPVRKQRVLDLEGRRNTAAPGCEYKGRGRGWGQERVQKDELGEESIVNGLQGHIEGFGLFLCSCFLLFCLFA